MAEHEGGTGDWPRGIGLVGAGAMGRAMLAGLLLGRPGLGPAAVVADAIPGAAEAGAAECGGRTGGVADAAAQDLVIVAVKPKDAPAALRDVAAGTAAGTVVLSVMAGWDLARLREAVPDAGLVRTMPNLAVRMGAGIVALAADGVAAGRTAALVELLRPSGAVVELPERLFPAATALAGSGPGLLALVVEALEEGGVGAGLSRDQARTMACGVVAGTAALLSDGVDPAVLRQRVSSPAGTTVAGVAVLERGAVRAHVADAVLAAARRAAEL
ncbi:MAG: pyrroline-5-carboxylate reductase [Thermoleophilia bacterium]|nr:pyrroline-5-carboxylate reductase [Thermoleophilia bacterium]